MFIVKVRRMPTIIIHSVLQDSQIGYVVRTSVFLGKYDDNDK